MVIADKDYAEIQIITKDNELIASITDLDIIQKTGYVVVCIPAKD